MRKAFTQHKSNAKQRGVEFLFDFEQWREWWLATGKWDQRGRGRDKYCMRRNGDVGPYSINNVFCGTNAENVRDGNLGKVMSDKTKALISHAGTGKLHPWASGEHNVMHRPEVKNKISAATSGWKHYRAKMVGTPNGIWSSATEAAKCLGIPKPTVEWRCRHTKLGFAYLA